MQRGIKKVKGQKSKVKSSAKIGLVVSEYNSDITFPMRDKAVETLKDAGVKEENISIHYAPGSFEIPIVSQKISKGLHGIIAIGCVIKGDTDHYHFIAQESTRGIMDVMLKTGTPIANAILTVNSLDQAKLRSSGKMNKGIEAAEAILKVMSLE